VTDSTSAVRRPWRFLLFAVPAFCLLCTLGIWQVQRLSEKNRLIAMIDARIAAEPQPLASVVDQFNGGADVTYTRVRAAGRFLATPDLRKITSFEGGAAFLHLAPFLSDEGIALLVERGSVPVAAKAEPVSDEPVEVTGILRLHNKGQGLFDPDNSAAANEWYWWDVPAMLASAPLPADAKVTSLILQLELDPANQGYPRATAPKAELRNNHLGYAITWFGLAAVVATMTGLYLGRSRA
jgi:surfeit locus 1 family protein